MPTMITITAARLAHILDGDETGGGHRSGSGDPTKTKFPHNWDDAMIIDAILAVANNPASIRAVQPNGKVRIEAWHNTVRIRVVFDPATDIIVTAHPL